MNYNRHPEIVIAGQQSDRGWPAVAARLRQAIGERSKCTVVIDCYMGTRWQEIPAGLAQALGADLVIHSEEAALQEAQLNAMLARNLTGDRVFGVLSSYLRLEEFFDRAKCQALQERVRGHGGIALVFGVGASLVAQADILVVADLARWEIQQRYRSGEMGNWRCDNRREDVLRKYKRGFFVEWRVCDKHKKSLFGRMDFILETNRPDDPVMISRQAFEAAMDQAVQGPFRLVPYFDPGVWGGQWMKQVCGLPREAKNYAWSFDGVPEENSVYLRIGANRMELPAADIVFTRPEQLLGARVHGRFGTEFPIRFDFLDTWEGQNLSLQVHPLTEYIQETFGMHYTQDESYYILDAMPASQVFLGLREGVDSARMLDDLARANAGEAPFAAENYVNAFPVKAHDHVLIPAGTVHCSGSGTMVLEISATPYIFTFKLWDWGRLGLDGKPRPVHLEHGAKNIVWSRDTAWVRQNLLHRERLIDQGEGWRIEWTGLHEREFIQTLRCRTRVPLALETRGSVHMLNLVQGKEAVVQSPAGAFAPFVVHYAETFIVPEQVGRYIIRPGDNCPDEEIAVIQASVRG